VIRRDRISLVIVCAATAVAIFALGGALRWSQSLVAFIAATGMALTIRSRRVFDRRPPLVVFLIVAAAWTTVQLVPLPAALVRALTPTLDALRRDGAELAGVSISSTLSMDPSATLRALTFFITLSGIAVVALRLSITERGRYALLACVAGAAGAAAMIAGLHELLGATTLYGVYQPTQLPPILGPLINPNHLGGLTAVGAVTSFGLLMYTKQSIALRVAWLTLTIICVIVTTATFSRGATVGLAAGAAVALATMVAQRMATREGPQSRRRREKFLVTTLPVGVMVTCSLVVAVYLGAGTVMNQLSNTTFEELYAPRTKFAAWRASHALIEESPWVGVGRGAFESAFTRVHPASAYATFSHPENELVQAVVEWGIPATIVLVMLLGWALLIAIRRWKDGPLAAGALGAIMVVAFQSNFDFGIELLGLAVPVVVILATLTYIPVREAQESRLRRIRVLRLGHAVAILVGAGLLFTPATRLIAQDHEALRANPSRATILEVIEAHPLDYLPFSLLAERLHRADDPATTTVLNHALRLHPTHPGLHWITARLMMRAGRVSQAEAEYLMAVRYSTDPRKVLSEVAATLPPERAAGAIPLDMPIEAVIRMVELDIAALWLERVFVHKGDLRAADTLYNLGTRFKNWQMAEIGARYRCTSIPSARCSLELAKVLVAANKPEEAAHELADVTEWLTNPDEQLAGWRLLCDAKRAAGKHEEAIECERRLELRTVNQASE
jgi:O-antigen ligase